MLNLLNEIYKSYFTHVLLLLNKYDLDLLFTQMNDMAHYNINFITVLPTGKYSTQTFLSYYKASFHIYNLEELPNENIVSSNNLSTKLLDLFQSKADELLE